VTKLSVSVPTALLRQAEALLLRPNETRSALIARLLGDAIARALEDQYARGYAEQPVTASEDAFLEAAASQAVAGVRAEEEAAGVPLMGGPAAYAAWKARLREAG
jgi:hypothetical protein